MDNLAKVIILNAFKGGVLKTTLASNIASLLSLRGKKVLLIDTDAQNDIRISFNIPENEDESNLYDLLVYNTPFKDCIYKYNDNLDLLLSDSRLENYEYDILTNIYKSQNYMQLLDDRLAKIQDDYDYIVIDTAPSFSILSLQVYYIQTNVTDSVDIIIPFHPEIYALKNLVRQINKINKFKVDYNKALNIKGIIPTKTMANNTHRMILNQTKQFLNASGINISPYEVKNTIKFTEYLITRQKPLALEKDSDLNKEFKQFKQLYSDILDDLYFKNEGIE